MNSAIYKGLVIHQRSRPKHHRLSYRVFSLFLDLDELESIAKKSRFFAYNRPGLLSFQDRDHGDGSCDGLKEWVHERLAQGGIELPGGRICVLCYPRIFGYVFNPLTVFYCYAHNGELTALLYEVSNTFKEKHTYIIPVEPQSGRMVRQNCAKRFHVSPFNEMENDYHFALSRPGETLSVVIRQHDQQGAFLAASFKARRVELRDRSLAQAAIAHPFMTLKIMGAIHWEAMKLWLKGLRVVRRVKAARAIEASMARPARSAE